MYTCMYVCVCIYYVFLCMYIYTYSGCGGVLAMGGEASLMSACDGQGEGAEGGDAVDAASARARARQLGRA
jgi:hypothetical protein